MEPSAAPTTEITICLVERCGCASTKCLGVRAKWNIVCCQNGVVPGWLGIYVRCKPCTIGCSSNVDAPPFDSRFLQLRCTNGFRVTHQAEACSMNQSCTAENPKRIQALQDPPSRTNAKILKKFTKMQKNSKRDKRGKEVKEELKRGWTSQDILSHRYFQLWKFPVSKRWEHQTILSLDTCILPNKSDLKQSTRWIWSVLSNGFLQCRVGFFKFELQWEMLEKTTVGHSRKGHQFKVDTVCHATWQGDKVKEPGCLPSLHLCKAVAWPKWRTIC